MVVAANYPLWPTQSRCCEFNIWHQGTQGILCILFFMELLKTLLGGCWRHAIMNWMMVSVVHTSCFFIRDNMHFLLHGSSHVARQSRMSLSGWRLYLVEHQVYGAWMEDLRILDWCFYCRNWSHKAGYFCYTVCLHLYWKSRLLSSLTIPCIVWISRIYLAVLYYFPSGEFLDHDWEVEVRREIFKLLGEIIVYSIWGGVDTSSALEELIHDFVDQTAFIQYFKASWVPRLVSSLPYRSVHACSSHVEWNWLLISHNFVSCSFLDRNVALNYESSAPGKSRSFM